MTRSDVSPVLERITDAFFALDPEWRFVYLNRHAGALLLRPVDELVGRSIWDAFPEAVDSVFWNKYHQAARSGEAVQFEAFYPPLDRWFEVNVYPDADGLSVYFRDSTDRHLALEALEASERRYRQILDSVHEIVFCKSPERGITYANRAAQEFYGVTEAELGGITDLSRDDTPMAQQQVQVDREVFDTGRTVVQPDESRIAPDGTVHYFHTVKAPVIDEEGKVTELVGVARDVTEQRAAREELERSQNHLLLALEAGRMGTWEWDIAAGRVLWSPQEERLYGLEEGAFEGTADAYVSRIHPDDRAEAWRKVSSAVEARVETHHVVHRILRADGQIRWLRSHGRFVYAEDGSPLRLVGVSADVTDEIRFEELRERRDEMLGAVDIGVWYCDLPFDELIWDRAVKEHFWLPPDARVTIETFYERIHPEDRDRTRRAIEESIATRSPYDIEYRTIPASDAPDAGAIRWVRAIGYTAYDASGNPIRFDGITVDITRPKEAAEMLAGSEQRYEYAALATSNAIWDWQFSDDTVRWNPGVYSVFGYAPGEVEETASWWYEQIHPEDRERVVHGIHAVIDDIGGASSWSDEYRFHRRGGSYAQVRDRGYIARDEAGRATRMIGAMEDVTARHEAELQLRRSEEQFRFITQAVPVQVWTAGVDGGLTYVSARVTDYFGQPAEELLGAGWARYVYPDDLERTGALWTQSLSSGQPYQAEFRLQNADGEYRWHLARALAQLDAEGRPVRWFGSNTDIHDQKLAERARDAALAQARHEQARLQEVFARSPSGILVTEGPGHRALFANDAYQELTGRRVLTGKPIREALPEMAEQGFIAQLDQVFSTGEPFIGKERAVLLDRNGDGAAEEYYFDFTYEPLRDVDGAVTGILLHAVDISEQVASRQRIESLAQQVEVEWKRLEELLEQAPASISMTTGPDHVGVMQNKLSRRLAGRDTVGRPIREAFPELAGQPLFDLLDRVYSSGESAAANEVYVQWDRDGDGLPESEGYFNVVYQPVRRADGSVEGILSHSVEVTDQVRARHEVEAKADELLRLTRALEETNRELDQFAYVASHDLKAPLRGIASLAQFVEEDLAGRLEDESLTHLQLLQGRVHRMEALIDGILTYSRAGRARSRIEPIDANVLVHEVIELISPPDGVVHIAEDMPTVVAERVPLQQVFLNLIGNALKHGSDEAPRVEVRWKEQPAHWEFSVTDNGPGIAAEYHERIWGIFQTLQPRDRVEGTGIGLSVVKKIVESRGGEVRVESEPGHGATFRFTIPKVPPSPT